MKRTFLYFVILSLAVIPANARRFASGPFELVVYPAKASESAQKYQLLPKADKQTLRLSSPIDFLTKFTWSV